MPSCLRCLAAWCGVACGGGRVRSCQEVLQSRLDDVSRLQAALRRKEADCEAVEAEIQKQIHDYQRLRQKLMQQASGRPRHDSGSSTGRLGAGWLCGNAPRTHAMLITR